MKKYLFLLACFGFFISCKDNKIIPDFVKPDKYTQSNKMWVTIDSIEYESCVSGVSPSAEADYNPSYLQLSGYFRKCSTGQDPLKWFEIYMEVVNVHKIGVYPLGDSLSGFGSYSRYRDNNFIKIHYRTNRDYIGEVNITDFQVGTRQVSGEFSFTAFDNVIKDSISVKGKFNNVHLTKNF